MTWHRSANSSARRRPGRRRQVPAKRDLSQRLPGAALKMPALAAAAASTVALDGLEYRSARPGASVNGAQMPGQLVGLIYELLDAHNDTARLAGDLNHGQCWETHLAYLGDLQRAGCETLAHLSLEEQT